jgi:single-stranded DNA-binding protein
MTCNNGTLVGTIVSDIQQKVINEDLSVVSFRVAPINSRENDSPIPVVAYNEQGMRLFSRANKGDTMAFDFRLRYVTWMTEEGEPRGRMEVIVYSSDMIRLGQISTQLRAEEAAGLQQQEKKKERTARNRTSPTLVTESNEVPF